MYFPTLESVGRSFVQRPALPWYELTIQRPASCNGHAQLQALLNTEDYSCAVCTGAGTVRDLTKSGSSLLPSKSIC